jgi:transcription antitermination factor NusG
MQPDTEVTENESGSNRQADNLDPICYPQWYALRIRSRFAGIASEVLRSKGYELYCPSFKIRRQWTDRVVTAESPLFPGYLFCCFDLIKRSDILATPGMIGIVGIGNNPIPVEYEELEAIRVVLKSGLSAQRWPYFNVGSPIRIEHGPLAGVQGTLLSADRMDKFVVSVNLLQRSVAVEIDPTWVRPVTSDSAVAVEPKQSGSPNVQMLSGRCA